MTSNRLYIAMAASAIAYLLALPGCATCSQPANAKLTECIVLKEVETCGPKAVAILLEVIPMAIAGDIAGAIDIVMTQGGSEATCIMAVLNNQMVRKYGLLSPEYKQFHEMHLAAERKKHGK